MGNGCTYSLAKIALFIFNALLVAYGFFLLAAGVFAISDIERFDHFLQSKMHTPPYLLFTVGLLIILVAIYGFVATQKESYCVLAVYALMLLLLFLFELGMLIFISMARSNFSDALRLSLRRSFSNYSFIDIDKKSWDSMQRKLDCCGIDGPRDWNIIYAGNQVPASCCLNAPDQPGVRCLNTEDSSIVHQLGCHQLLLRRIADRISTVYTLGATAAALQFCGILLTIGMMLLVKKHKNEKANE